MINFHFNVNFIISSRCILAGVLFALKVITTAETGARTAYIMGIPVPSKYAAWAELVAIHLLVPNASFLGHLAGILAGCAYMSSPLGRVVDYFIQTVTGISPSYVERMRC